MTRSEAFLKMSEILFKLLKYAREGESIWGIMPDYGVMEEKFFSYLKAAGEAQVIAPDDVRAYVETAKLIAKKEHWLKVLYVKKFTSVGNLNGFITNNFNTLKSTNKAVGDVKGEMVKKLVTTLKGLQKGKVALSVTDADVYTAEITCVALDTLYHLGLMSGSECKEYIRAYIVTHNIPETPRTQMLNMRFNSLTFAHDDGCHDTIYPMQLLWSIYRD